MFFQVISVNDLGLLAATPKQKQGSRIGDHVAPLGGALNQVLQCCFFLVRVWGCGAENGRALRARPPPTESWRGALPWSEPTESARGIGEPVRGGLAKTS